MRNLCTLFMASAFLMSVGCSPTTPLHPAGLDANRGIGGIENATARANELLEAGKFLPSDRDDQKSDTRFQLTFDDDSKISQITTLGLTEHYYSSNNSLLKGDTRIFVPNLWNEDSSDDVVIFLVQEEDNSIYGEVHLVSSEMMNAIHESDNEATLEGINYNPKGVKANFAIAASEIQASTTIKPSVIYYAINVDGEESIAYCSRKSSCSDRSKLESRA